MSYTDLYVHTGTEWRRTRAHTHTFRVPGVFTVTPVCVVRSGKCLTNYMPIMFGMSASALPGSNASAHTHTHTYSCRSSRLMCQPSRHLSAEFSTYSATLFGKSLDGKRNGSTSQMSYVFMATAVLSASHLQWSRPTRQVCQLPRPSLCLIASLTLFRHFMATSLTAS